MYRWGQKTEIRGDILYGWSLIVSQENEGKILILSVLNCSLPVGDKTIV